MSGKPVVHGYTVEWNDTRGEWVATSQPEGLYVLRGRDQAELNAARRRLVDRLTSELLDAVNGAAERGYSPPPRTTTPEDSEATPLARESRRADPSPTQAAEGQQPPSTPRRPAR